MLKNADSINYGVEKAKSHASEHGIAIGEIVAHESDKISYELKEVRENIAVVWLNKEGTEKEFPLDEIFDVNLVRSFAREYKEASMGQKSGLKKMDKYHNN